MDVKKYRSTFSSGCPSFSYMANRNSGTITKIIPIIERLLLPVFLSAMFCGTPMSAASVKHMSCRFVNPRNTFVFTFERSLGT